MASFGTRLAAVFEEYGHLCVGIDPHTALLEQWGLKASAQGLREFGLRTVEAAAGRVGAVKPQVAFFEAFGPAGLGALAEVQQAAREAGLLVIADAKRGDIGSTMAAYAQAWLDPAAELAADALTVSPYLGFGSLRPAVEAAQQHGTGIFALVLTSNPEGAEVQLARDEAGRTVAGSVAEAAAEANGAALGAGAPLGDAGLVVGATTARLATEHGIDLTAGRPPILAPGYGAQGASAAQLKADFGPAWGQVVVNSSRGILRCGPDVEALRGAIDRARMELAG
ncbi:orotidine-5'-phosphate decarboxylase [Nesterenkonia populi]|uniref:orotidine-5'-phosphate decarboxylase n=1 Tax=Nesterenkonia populi TaxID=1591087 RepID=UPI0011BFC886|nr:orotidine-5'-phosphate decarboxylase [Nesterenkonia populi]